MMASAGSCFSASSPSRCLFKVPGVEMSAAGSRLPTGRNGALSRINGVVEVGGGICNDIGRVTGVEAGSMEMTLFRLVFSSSSLSPSCRVSLAIFLFSFAWTLRASRVRSSASSTS